MRFWLERGVDGFRIDALRQAMKDDQWRDNPPNPDWREGEDPYHALLPEFSADRPEVAEVVRVLRDAVEEARAADGRERVLIGELYLPIERLMAYYGYGVDLPANFHLLQTPWRAADVGALVDAYEAALPDGAWPNWVLGNHDRPRVATRVGAGAGAGRGRAAAHAARDADALLRRRAGDAPTSTSPPERGPGPVGAARPGRHGRDGARTPMQWDDGPNAGFCDAGAQPWLPLSDDAATAQRRAFSARIPTRCSSLHRDLLALRRAEPALTRGRPPHRRASTATCLAYERRRPRARGAQPRRRRRREAGSAGASGTVALGSARGRAGQRIAARRRARRRRGAGRAPRPLLIAENPQPASSGDRRRRSPRVARHRPTPVRT